VFLYRILVSLLAPLLVLRACADAIRARSLVPLAQRLGLIAPQAAPCIWLHAASVGEVTSARPLIDRLLVSDPRLHLLVTLNTSTALGLVTGWADPRIAASLAPVDHRLCLAAFLRRARPRALVTVEGELWPNRFAACRRRVIPVLLVSARLSDRSARIWGRVPALARAVLAPVTYISAQDDASADRFRALGLPASRIGPVLALKALAADAAPAPPFLPYPRPYTLLAASTHDGEEGIVLDAFLSASARQPALRLILAPRHPRRRDEIEAMIVARGLAFATRSRGQTPDAARPVYLADTIGEMPLWYAAAGMTFTGGSLVPLGGHTPFEPAAAGSAILHGPHFANFAPAYAALNAAQAATSVTDAPALAAAILVLADPALQRARAKAARDALAPFAPADGLAPILAALAAAIR
jgi:3-deoxy-D-manno-octulosonic-acid transferase